MSEPSQAQHSAADSNNHAQPGTGNDVARPTAAAPVPVEAQPFDALELFTDLVAACVPAFCDGLQFDLATEDASGLSATFPPAPAPAAADTSPDAAHVDTRHAEQLSGPGRMVLASRTELAGGPPVVATITCTWHDQTRPSEADALVVRLLADQAAATLRLNSLGVALQTQLTRAANLEEALATNREIGQAIGILMATAHLTADQAFGRLRTASQHTHRKLREIAAEVTETGALTLSPALARSKNARTPDGRGERRDGSTRGQRRTRAGQPIAAAPDGAPLPARSGLQLGEHKGDLVEQLPHGEPQSAHAGS